MGNTNTHASSTNVNSPPGEDPVAAAKSKCKYHQSLSHISVNEHELDIINSAYTSQAEKDGIEQLTFEQHHSEITDKLSHKIYQALKHSLPVDSRDTTPEYRGLTFDRYICGIVKCCKSMTEPRTQFMFRVFTNHKDEITYEEFVDTLTQLSLSAFSMLHSDLFNCIYDTADSDAFDSNISQEKRQKDAVEEVAMKAFGIEDPHKRHHHKMNYKKFKVWFDTQPQIEAFVQYVVRKEYQPEQETPQILQQTSIPARVQMIGRSELYNDHILNSLREHLPANLRRCDAVMLYNSTRNGYSFPNMVLRYQKKHRNMLIPCVIIIRDDHNNVFGAFVMDSLKKYSRDFYGSKECALFKVTPKFEYYASTGSDNHYIHPADHGIGFGGEIGSYGLVLESDFLNGRSQQCATYNNKQFTDQSEFSVKTIECWGFIERAKSIELIESYRALLKAENENGGHVKSVLDDKENTFVLELLGKNYSAMIKE